MTPRLIKFAIAGLFVALLPILIWDVLNYFRDFRIVGTAFVALFAPGYFLGAIVVSGVLPETVFLGVPMNALLYAVVGWWTWRERSSSLLRRYGPVGLAWVLILVVVGVWYQAHAV